MSNLMDIRKWTRRAARVLPADRTSGVIQVGKDYCGYSQRGDKGTCPLGPPPHGGSIPSLLGANEALSQLSYVPLVGLARLELATSRLSGVRSNQLSYSPKSNRVALYLGN